MNPPHRDLDFGPEQNKTLFRGTIAGINSSLPDKGYP
jgi:hypothetical protein